MTRSQATGRLRKLEAITVERGATPAEAAMAAQHARRLIRRFGLGRSIAGSPVPRGSAQAPGVHVVIVRDRVFAPGFRAYPMRLDRAAGRAGS